MKTYFKIYSLIDLQFLYNHVMQIYVNLCFAILLFVMQLILSISEYLLSSRCYSYNIIIPENTIWLDGPNSREIETKKLNN